MLIDTHAHLAFDNLSQNIENILERASSVGVEKIINVCTDDRSMLLLDIWNEAGISLYHAAAVTPHDVAERGKEFFSVVERYARGGKLVAVGETGLDYYYKHSPVDQQKDFFIRHLHLALETRLPIIIHCRDAFDDLFEILDDEYGAGNPGVLHCFTGSLEEALQAIERGLFISFSGIITFKNSGDLREVARQVPLDSCLIETDAPYLAPQKYRGKTNEPAYVVEVAKMLAEIHGITIDDVAKITTNNANKLFGI